MRLDTKVPNAASFLFRKEDHTLGNLLRAQLLKDDRVLYAGYKIPHPLEHDFLLRVQTDSEDYKPEDAVQLALQRLLVTLELLKNNFISEWDMHGQNHVV